MNPRTILVGFLAGILAASLLYSPFTIIFPAPYIAQWPAGNINLAWAAAGLAVLLVVLGGAAAARVGGLAGRGGGACSGSAAGAFAGMLVFASSGAAAAGVYGSRMLLTRPLEAAANQNEFMSLLSEAVLQTVFWTYIAAWLLMLGGAVLGALGGALAGGKPGKASYHLVWLSTSIAGMLVSALAFLVTVVINSLLPEQVTKASLSAEHTLSLPTWTLISLPALTCLSFFVLFQVMGWLALRGIIASSESKPLWRRWAVYLAAALPCLSVIGLFFLARSALSQPLIIVGLLVTFLMSWLLLTTKSRTPVMEPPGNFSTGLPGWSAFLSISALAVLTIISAAASLNTVMLIIPQIVLLAPDSASSSAPGFASMAELVNANYTIYGALFNGLLWAPFIAGALGIGSGWLWEHRPGRTPGNRVQPI